MPTRDWRSASDGTVEIDLREIEPMKKAVSRFLICGLLFGLALQVLGPSSDYGKASSTSSGSGLPYSAEWRITGPTGGDVRALVVDPQDPNRFYFGTLDGQLYTSTDGARNWRLLMNFNRPRLFVDHIIVDPRSSKVLYVATHRHKDPGGFFKSTDGGLTWREAPELRNEAVHSLTQSVSDPNILIAGTFNGIFRSQDSGETWTPLPTTNTPGLMHVESLAIVPRDTNVIYAGTWYLPYKTTDGFWRSAKAGENNSWMVTTSRQLEINSIAVHPRNPNTIYIGTNNYGVMVSTDGGKNFVPSNTGFSGRFVNTIVTDRENVNRVYATTINTSTGGGFFFVSSDGGASWQPSMRNMPPRLIAYSILQDERDGNLIY